MTILVLNAEQIQTPLCVIPVDAHSGHVNICPRFVYKYPILLCLNQFISNGELKKYENQITARFDKIHLSSVIFQLIFS